MPELIPITRGIEGIQIGEATFGTHAYGTLCGLDNCGGTPNNPTPPEYDIRGPGWRHAHTDTVSCRECYEKAKAMYERNEDGLGR